MVPMLMCGFLRSNFSLDMIAISFSESTFTWPVDWRPPATEMRQGFLGLVGLRSHGGGQRARARNTRGCAVRGHGHRAHCHESRRAHAANRCVRGARRHRAYAEESSAHAANTRDGIAHAAAVNANGRRAKAARAARKDDGHFAHGSPIKSRSRKRKSPLREGAFVCALAMALQL